MQAWLRAAACVWETLGSVMRDVRFGLRRLRKEPLFTTLVVGTLGLGIGAFTIVFSLVDGVLMREMPYEQPGELVNIWKTFPAWQGQDVLDDAWDKVGLNWSEFLTLRDNSQLLAEVAVRRNRTMVLTGAGAPERLEVGGASSGLFPMLGVRPLLGRVFLPGEEGPGTARLAVLSHSVWANRFGSDPDIVGRKIELDAQPFEVIGVLPPGFRLRSTIFNLLNSAMDTGERALWVPIGFDRLGAGWSLEATGRLLPGATPEQLRAELDALLRDCRTCYVPAGQTAAGLGFRLTHPKEEIVGGHRSSLLLLLAASGILLVIACGNIAALVMSEAVERKHEIATRIALGAGRLRIGRQVLTETVLLGVFGSALGIAIAAVGIQGFLALAPPLPRLEEVGLNHGVLLFSVLAGVGTGILFGLAPAFSLHVSALRVAQGMEGRGSAVGRGRFQRGLIAGELALTIVLLMSAGLFVRSLLNLSRVDPGFDASSVATVRMHLGSEASQYPGGARQLVREVLDRIRAIPGVERAGAVDGLPFPGVQTGTVIQIVGRSQREGAVVIPRNHLVLPGYLETMKIPLLVGRTLTEADTGAGGRPGILINEQMARQYWPNESPLGGLIQQDGTVYEVVGIVGDVRERHLSEPPEAMVYRAGPQIPGAVSLVARTSGAPEDLVAQMRAAIWAVSPQLSLSQQTTMTNLVQISTGDERYRTMLVSVFGALATLLAAAGVFGVTAHSVSKRAREMGIRMALGAQSGRLVRGMVFETMLPGVVGIGAGFLGALVVSRLLTCYLFGIEAWDPPTFCGVIILLGCLSIGAAVLPASRVGRVDPMRVLREE
jgi:putative ABC transport system permease protein